MYFEDTIDKLNEFWRNQGCSILQPFHMPIGAGTLHPATVFGCLQSNEIYKIAYVQPSYRPYDGRGGKNPNRLMCYFQYQVIISPPHEDMQKLFLDSLSSIGMDVPSNDVRFVEDDWENPSIGASGVGWEIWFNGMEIAQFTYMQQIGGIKLDTLACELTYGLERVIMHIQDVGSVYDIKWNSNVTYGDIFKAQEQGIYKLTYNGYSADTLTKMFNNAEKNCMKQIDNNNYIGAYYVCLEAINIFNNLEAMGYIGNLERASYIQRTRNMTNLSCALAKNIKVERNEKD